MAPLPPVRKRSTYRDIRSDDLVFALFHDRVMGKTGDMDPDRAFDPAPSQIARKVRLLELKLELLKLKHGKHDQSTHGRKGRAGKAGASAYASARAGGASHQEALGAAKQATTQERAAIRAEAAQKRTERLQGQAERARRAANSGEVTEAQRAALLDKANRLDARARGERVGPRQKPAPPPAPVAKPKRAPRAKTNPDAKVYTAIRQEEDRIRPQRFETAHAVDADGKVILNIDGQHTSVGFSDAQVAKLRAARGVVMTHNHPLGWDVPASDPRRQGNSFSLDDIQFAADANLFEIRATTPTRTFYARRPAGGWDWGAIRTRYDNVNRETRSAFTQRIREGKMKPEDAEAAHNHAVWLKVFGDLNIDYGIEQL